MTTETIVLKAEIRKEVGTKSTARIRAAGKTPAVVYGHKKEAISIALDQHGYIEALHHGHRLFDIDIEGKSEKVLIKELQYDYLGKDVIHTDFVRVNLDEKVTVEVRIVLKGHAVGTDEGGILDEQLDRLQVECLVTAIPESIEVSVKDIKIGDTIYAKDVVLPEGVTLVTDPDALILSCHIVAAAKSAEEIEEEETTAAEPEVLTEKNKEEEGQG